MLVVASILIWGNPVSGLQFFGYSIALAGMVYYKLGADTLKAAFSENSRRWAEYGSRKPAQRKMVVFAGAILVIMILVLGLAPSLGYDPAGNNQAQQTKTWWQSIMGFWGSSTDGSKPT